MPPLRVKSVDRRRNRTPVSLYGEVVGSRAGDGYQCFVTSVSELGLYLDSPVDLTALLSRKCWVGIELPHVSETICIVGEVISTATGPIFHEAAIRFSWMAPDDWETLRGWLRREHDVSKTRIKLPAADELTEDSGVFKLDR